ncbi:unnamed protein product [Colias eurytheme]|nr:unnamed protein product [Colias eurytheme]
MGPMGTDVTRRAELLPNVCGSEVERSNLGNLSFIVALDRSKSEISLGTPTSDHVWPTGTNFRPRDVLV